MDTVEIRFQPCGDFVRIPVSCIGKNVVLQAQPDTIKGTVMVGKITKRTVTIRNAGTAVAEITDATLNPNRPDWNLVNIPKPLLLAPGQDYVATVEVNPTPIKRNAYHFSFYPKLWIELFAEKRYGLSIGYQINYTQLFSNNYFKQVLSYSGKGGDLEALTLNRSSRLWHTLEFRGRLDTNPESDNGKFFFSARFNWQSKDVNSFYPQVQIGYAFSIFK